MNQKAEILEGSEVVSVAKEDKFLMPHQTFRSDEYIEEIGKRLGSTLDDAKQKWLNEGVDCEVLTPNQGWRKGKVRIRLEFYPEDGDSPAVAEIRRGMAEEMHRRRR